MVAHIVCIMSSNFMLLKIRSFYRQIQATGYGYDFANAIQNAYPGNDYDDIMYGVDEAEDILMKIECMFMVEVVVEF